MTTLRAAPYNLVLGSVVKAIIRAYNSNGFGQYS